MADNTFAHMGNGDVTCYPKRHQVNQFLATLDTANEYGAFSLHTLILTPVIVGTNPLRRRVFAPLRAAMSKREPIKAFLAAVAEGTGRQAQDKELCLKLLRKYMKFQIPKALDLATAMDGS
jgi:hypothetical protein